MVRISIIVTEIDALILQKLFDDVMRINFRFRLFVPGHLRMAVMHLFIKFGADIFIQFDVIDIFSEIKDGGYRHLGFDWWNHGTAHEGAAITDHVVKENHVIGWDEASILGRWIGESIEIRKQDIQGDTMNRDAGTYTLSHLYDALFSATATSCGENRNRKSFRQRQQMLPKRQ